MKPLTLAYSPCPNDTFIFTPWVEGHIDGALPVVERFEDIVAVPVGNSNANVLMV